MEVESTKKQSLNLPRLPVPPQGHINIRDWDRTSTTLPPTGFKPVLSAYFNTRIWHGVLYWLSPFTKGNDPLRQSHVRVTTLLFCLYFQKSFHSSNNAPIYAMYTYINHCKESSMTIFLIIGLQYPWRRNLDSDPGTTLRCLRFSRPLHSTTLPLRHNNEFLVPQKSFARLETQMEREGIEPKNHNLGYEPSALTSCAIVP